MHTFVKGGSIYIKQAGLSCKQVQWGHQPLPSPPLSAAVTVAY